MYRRKLLALDYTQPEQFDVNNEAQVRQLVVWLEDQKIRHLKIEDRAGLRDTASANWGSVFQNYLTELNCPYIGGRKEVILDWLLGYAVRLEHGDDAESYRAVTKETVQKAQAAGAPSSNPLDNLDFQSAEFKAGVTSLAMLLQIPPHKDHLEQLKAISLLVTTTLSKQALENAGKKANTKTNEHIPLDKTELGFESGDYIMNEAAKIVRLLHLKELRDLQSKINSAIVAVQAITADPKTDSRLGKVGR
ncbi:RNA transcription, translation and transport factor protein-like [Babylonia areolata]|uniref:RNA transcription, translation and transport factor protein-like n=1 Tax=Babylonia areolata TaxID=304850 RepID=UPI003FD437B7